MCSKKCDSQKTTHSEAVSFLENFTAKLRIDGGPFGQAGSTVIRWTACKKVGVMGNARAKI